MDASAPAGIDDAQPRSGIEVDAVRFRVEHQRILLAQFLPALQGVDITTGLQPLDADLAHVTDGEVAVQRLTQGQRRVAAQDQDIKALSAANAILRGKLTESPHAASDLRERLVCAIWPVLIQQWREYKDAIDPRGCARADALEEADKMLAAMRKEEA